MECQVCKQREATVHLTQIVDDDMRSLDLCEGCAKQKGVSDPVGFSLAEFFQEPAAAGEAAAPVPARPAGELQCPRCGLAQAEFKKTGRLGCSDCYQVFAEALEGVLKGMHKGTRHVGKVPRVQPTAGEPTVAVVEPRPSPPSRGRIEQLSAELEAAVAREDFEAAARLRDEIRAAKAGLARSKDKPA